MPRMDAGREIAIRRLYLRAPTALRQLQTEAGWLLTALISL